MYSPLRILMWKHGIVRIKRFILTPVELLSPVLLFILFFLLKDVLLIKQPEEINSTADKIFNTEEFILDAVYIKTIVYIPENNQTKALMDQVGPALYLPRLNTLPDQYDRGYYGADNEAAVEHFVKNMSEDQVVVIFEPESFNRHLQYTIRTKMNYKTERYTSEEENLNPHHTFGVEYEAFMRLQWYINKNYLLIRTGSPVNISDPVLQEFPFVDLRKNPMSEPLAKAMAQVCFVSVFLPFVFLMTRLIEERLTGVQELIKIAGVSPITIAISHLLNALPTGLFYSVVGTSLLKATSNPYLPESNGFLVFLVLALHYWTVVAMAFVCSFLTKRNQYVTTLAMLTYVVLWLPVRLLNERTLPRAVTLLCGVFPHMPMYWFWSETAGLETYGKGVDFSTMFRSHTERSGSVFGSIVAMLVQVAVLSLVTVYLNLVCPGPHGTPLPWNFFLKKKVNPEMVIEELEEPMVREPQYFEQPPGSKEVGIQISNVTKIFDKDRALTNVTFDVYNGEITVLLGHNGAGKTTLMSIITGMAPPSAGRVLVLGRAGREARRHLGVCTQHNLFLPDLSVLQHVMFFGMMKGKLYHESRSCGLDLLDELGLKDKASCASTELSGGMQRRLQLACALAGGADVLVLDEPTSGLDVETRRELWDLLLSLRGKRTVLLTTHFMEEADALGDRVVALHRGILRCHASPIYLKRHIGNGYRLTLTTIGHPRTTDITKLVLQEVPDATIQQASLNSVIYNLPAHTCGKFPQLFTALEENRSAMGIDNIGVGMPTLEEVFLKLCSNVDTSFAEDQIDGNTQPAAEFRTMSGIQLYLRQIVTLIVRNIYYLLSNKMYFLVMQVLIPVALIVIFTYTITVAVIENEYKDSPSLALNLSLYKDMKPRVYYNMEETDAFKRVKNRYAFVDFVKTNDINESILAVGKSSLNEYKKFVLGLELNNTYTKLWYTTLYRHTAPIALDLLSNLLSALTIPWADGNTVLTHNHPLGRAPVLAHARTLYDPLQMTSLVPWAILIVIIYLSTIASAGTLACRELASGTRHIHVMSGCPATLHWLTRLAFHCGLYSLVLLVPIVVSLVVFDTTKTMLSCYAIGGMVLIFLLGMATWLAFTYLLSFYLGENGLGIILNMAVFIGITAAGFQGAVLLVDEPLSVPVTALLSLSLYLLPSHALSLGAIKVGHVARINAFCEYNQESCGTTSMHTMQGLDVDKCCVSHERPASFFEFDDYFPAAEMVILAVQFVFYMSLVILLEEGLISGLAESLLGRVYRAPPKRYNDHTVRAESTYVSKAIDMPKKQIPDAMLADNLHKRYVKLGKSVNSVKGISFSVKKGECFGVLGVNGAGKSTTFKMIVGETCPTRGRAFSNGEHLKCPRDKYLRTLSYCPQFFGLDEFLSGADNLELLLTLRGLSPGDIADEVDAWIRVVGLEEYRSQHVATYSGGCKRRLATAAALCAGAPLTLLDEPTAGVDVSARRRVWAALRRALAARRAVIITSHSMDEMEALCSRIAIVSGGEVCALDSPGGLRATHAAGHAVHVKIHAPGDEIDGEDPVSRLKSDMQSSFNCKLKDEHKTMLHYHINETMSYSALFSQLEELKEKYSYLVEDYTVTETTLEEVFLSFAHEQDKPVESNNHAYPV